MGSTKTETSEQTYTVLSTLICTASVQSLA